MNAYLSQRERAKAERRTAIFDATRDLFRNGSDFVSAQQIAERAGVSTATLYNLVGKREELLAALLNQLFAELGERLFSARAKGDPVLAGAAIVGESVSLFCEDPSVWRQIVHELSGRSAGQIADHVSARPVDLQIQAMKAAEREGRLKPGIDPEAAARQIFASYNGALYLWSGGFASDATFAAQALFGYWTVIAAFGTETERVRAFRKLKAIGCPDYGSGA